MRGIALGLWSTEVGRRREIGLAQFLTTCFRRTFHKRIFPFPGTDASVVVMVCLCVRFTA